jgi:hypothetical protein
MSEKLEITVGPISLACESDGKIASKDMLDLLEKATQLYLDKIANLPSSPPGSGGGASPPPPGKVHGTTSNIAAKLGCKSGPDLVLASAAFMKFVEGKERLPRKEILENMKNATAYYKNSYRSNLSSTLKSMVTSGKLSEISKNVYSLSADAIKEIEDKFA